MIFLFQTTLNFYSTPQTYAATPNAPTINNLNDGSGTTDTTPTFSFDISDPDGLDVLSYTLEIEEAGEDFTTPLVTKTGSLVSNTSEIIAAGDAHTIALKSDGTVWTWGDNSFGQLGDGTTTDHETALQISGLENVTQVAVGAYHTVVLKADGTVWAWGNNTYGQLGDNSNTHRYEPVQVNNLTDVIEIGAGLYHTFAVKSDGTLWAWGDNYYGQLGDGTTDERITPVQITTLTNITKVSAGEYHSIALKSDGTVWAWGDNYYGQIGDGTDIERDTPVQVNGLSGIDDIVAGVNHSLALKSDGTVWSWGNNSDGQLGDNSTTQRDEPVQVSGLTNVSNIAAGALHSIALTQSGVVLTWGDNLYGQLGDGTNTQKNVPTELSSISEVIQITAGSADSVVVKSDGTVWAWGNNDGGALGNNTTTHSNTPVQSLTSTLDPFFIKTDAQEYLGVTDTLETSLELGDYIWRVSVTDLAENQSPWTTASTGFSIISEGSNTAPNTPVILNYNNGASVNDTTPSLEFSLSDPDQSDPGENLKYQLQIDNNADFVSPEVNYTEIDFSSAPRNNVVFTASILSEGQYFWRVKAIDDEDLESSWQTATNGFIIDTSLPVSTIYYPQDNSTLKKVERIFGQSTDNNGVNYTRISVRNLSTQLYYNGSTFGSETEVWLETLGETSGAETTQWHYILSGWEDEKSYTIRSRATDMAGNEEHTDTVTFTYNTSEGETGSIYVSNPTVMNNSNYKIYYPNTAEIPTDADFEIDFDDNFTFSPWLNEEDIELSDQG